MQDKYLQKGIKKESLYFAVQAFKNR